MIYDYLKDPNKFWKRINLKRSARINVDLPLSLLENAYEDNFNP